MANILLFAMVNHISPASRKSFESAPAGAGIRQASRSKAKAMDPEIARNQDYDDYYANDSKDVSF
jgi:hypothetical protein